VPSVRTWRRAAVAGGLGLAGVYAFRRIAGVPIETTNYGRPKASTSGATLHGVLATVLLRRVLPVARRYWRDLHSCAPISSRLAV
jgi:hypothetical protein